MLTIKTILIQIETNYYYSGSDNGKGITPEFLETNEDGIQQLFLENVTSKITEVQNAGYGCYIAYEIM